VVRKPKIQKVKEKKKKKLIKGQATSKLLSLAAASRVHLFCNLQSRARIGDRLV
jgi:hypothetical protein